ncbi:MAG: CHAT domain-containing protein, partial [Bacteroidetes bacterium]|nr:CHAT domain-containing protein [Bacteroidota bacterium]
MYKTLLLLVGLWIFLPGKQQLFARKGAVLKDGIVAEKSGDYRQAKSIYLKLYHHSSSVDPSEDKIVLALSRIYNLLTEYDSAAFFLGILRKKMPLKDDSLSAAVYLQEAILHMQRDQYDQAWNDLETLASSAKKIPDTLKTEIHILEGWLYLKKNQFDLAEKQLLSVLENEQTETLIQARVNYLLGYLFQLRKSYAEALEYFHIVESLFKKDHYPSHPYLAATYNLKGQIYRETGDLNLAREYHHLAFEIQKKVLPANHVDLFRTHMFQGVCAYMVGDYGQALDYYQLALRIALVKFGKTHRTVASLYNNIGIVYYGKKKFEKALEAYQEAAGIYKQILGENNLVMASVYNNMGLSYAGLDKYSEALAYYEKAYQIRRKLLGENDLSLVSVYNNMGLALNETQAYNDAILYAQKALNLFSGSGFPNHPRAAKHCNNIARIYKNQGQYDEAIAWHQEAFRRIDPEFNPQSPCDNPPMNRLRLDPEVLDILLYKARTMDAGEKDGKDYSKLCQLETYRLASDFVDSMRVSYLAEDSKFELASRTRLLYENAITLCWELYEGKKDKQFLEQAFYFSEKQKSVILLESVRSESMKNFGGVADSLRELESNLKHLMAEARESMFYEKQKKEKANQESIQKYSDQFFEAWHSHDSLITLMDSLYPEYVRFKYRSQPPSLEEIAQNAASRKVDLIEYFLGQEYVYLFYFHDGKVSWSRKKIDKEFPLKIRAFRESIYRPFLDVVNEDSVNFFAKNYVEYGEELYRQLISPIREKNQPNQRLVIIPDGILGYLPFDALLMEKPARIGAYRSYPYLLREYQISFQYSAALFLGEKSANRAGETVSEAIAFSPAYNSNDEGNLSGGKLSALPYGRKEVEAISQLFSMNAFFDEKANKETFLSHASQADLIHISAHARVNDATPKLSAIYFGNEDSLLILDLFNLSLKAQLVTLSACETGMGELYQGEGIMSLARGFTYAGASSIINSLWQVNDETTAKVITQFYRELVAGKPKDEALQQAQLQYIEESDQL